MASVRMLAAMMVAVLVATTSFTGQAAAEEDCTTKLMPCIPYLNATTGTTPPETCCAPLKSAVANQRTCICDTLFNTPGLLESLGVNSTQVVNLAASCGVNADPATICKTAAPADAPSPSPSPSAVATTPAAAAPPPGTSATTGNIIDVGVLSLILVLVSLMLH